MMGTLVLPATSRQIGCITGWGAVSSVEGQRAIECGAGVGGARPRACIVGIVGVMRVLIKRLLVLVGQQLAWYTRQLSCLTVSPAPNSRTCNRVIDMDTICTMHR